jgi:hypothetical protein
LDLRNLLASKRVLDTADRILNPAGDLIRLAFGFQFQQVCQHIALRSSAEPPVYVEIMTWEAGGMRPAHEHPDVIPIWERMKSLVEERAAQHDVPGMSFPFYRRIEPRG